MEENQGGGILTKKEKGPIIFSSSFLTPTNEYKIIDVRKTG